MKVFAISDPHLSFGIPSKNMEVFGPSWKDYTQKLEEQWRRHIQSDDLVLIPGDISWAIRLEDALIDLQWLDALPGIKVMIRGNHDLWWPSSTKLAKVLPPSFYFIYNNAFTHNDVTIGGSRLWDSEEYRFDDIILFQENPRQRQKSKEELAEEKKAGEKIFVRELERLKMSLKQLDPKARHRIAMTHYPPIGLDLRPSLASKIFEEYRIEIVVFGHLHSVKKQPLFGKVGGIKYLLTSCDYLDFTPIQIL